MRDILLTLVILGLVPVILRRPAVGAFAWAWISMMNPHKLTFGFASTMPFAQLIGAATLVGFIFSDRKNRLPMVGGTILLLLLMFWMTVSSVFSINDSAVVWDRWIFVMKIHTMLLFTLVLLRERVQIERLIWVIVVSLGYFGVKGGIFTLTTGGGGRVWGPPGGMLLGNNEFAVGLILIVPLMYFLYETNTRKWVKRGLMASMILIALAILGSQSRGALIGLLAMAAMLGIKSKYPLRSSLALGVLLLCAIAFMPDTWTQRMDTIQGYEADTSAMSRIWTWNTLWNVALARPLVGAGFGAESANVFAVYAPTGAEFEIFQGKAWVAHSIYFQALGEHGFPGLLLYLSIGVWIWWAAGQTAKQGQKSTQLITWVPLLMRMCQVSLVGFAAGGAFLSLMNLDVPYYLLAIVALTQQVVQKEIKRDAVEVTSIDANESDRLV